MITTDQERAIQDFIDTWNLSMPYHDIGSALNCGECDALYALLMAFNAPVAAEALLQAHVAGDDEGDEPEHIRIKIGLQGKRHLAPVDTQAPSCWPPIDLLKNEQ